MAKKIAITLRKGSSGKTTTAVNLAAALHQKGKRVLLVDLDPEANATLAVGIDPTTLSKHINHLFTSIDVQPTEVITQTTFGLPILPSHPDLASTQSGMKATQVGLLRSLLTQLESRYDLIILDTPPAESYMAVNALVAADEVIIVLQAHFLALQGLSQALTQIQQVRSGLNPDLHVAGILPTLVNPRTNISRTVLEDAQQAYPDLLLPLAVEWSVKHIEASLAGQPIVIYDPTHQGAIAYMELAERFI